MLNKGFVMHFFWCAIMSCLISLPLQAALTRSDLIAINSIEKEINNFLVRKPVHWQQQVQARINQLEKQYVVKGYKQQNVNAFKNELIEQEVIHETTYITQKERIIETDETAVANQKIEHDVQ